MNKFITKPMIVILLAVAVCLALVTLLTSRGDTRILRSATPQPSLSERPRATAFAFGDEAPLPARTVAAATVQGSVPADLDAEADGDVTVRIDPATGTSNLLRVNRGGDLFPQGRNLQPAAKAGAFMARHGSSFGIRDAASELRLIGLKQDQYGNTRVSWQQMHGDIPVFGAVIHSHVSSDGRLTAVNGKFVPSVNLPTQPRVPQGTATQLAVTAVSGQLPARLKNAALDVASTALVVYREYLTRGTPGQNHLAYQVEVGNGSSVREFVFVDAVSGKIVDQVSGIHGVKNRRVYEAQYDPDSPNLPPPAWQEGDLRPAPDPAHEDEIAGGGEAYNLYFNLSGGTYRSWDGNDADMITVNNDPTILCPNANWNGTSTNYCSGTSADDVVVHEWSHAYTQETSGLIYQWQSGALNESYSDIFGETVDILNNRDGVEGSAATGTDGPRSQDESVCSEFTSELPTGDSSLRWLIGEDAYAFTALPPVGDAAIRDMWNPACSGGTLFRGDPGHMTSENYYCASGDAGGVHYNSAINNRAYAILVDGNTLELRDDGTPFADPVTVNGIGLTKAAHIFWRANSVYNTPSTTLPENADSLEMACEDLIGVNLTKLVTTAEDGTGLLGTNDDTVDPTPELSGEVITADDCAQVANAIAAVEMRHDVTKQCGFKNLLDPAPAPRCGNAEVETFFSEDWENGFPAGWSVGQSPVSKSVLDTREWFVRSGDLPANPDGSVHAGAAIFQENRRDLGNCTTDDESGTLYLDSPPITVGTDEPGHVLFEHYVNTETGYDGGNLMISINGGPFELVPGDAFEHNPYGSTLTGVADQNTNPKAGEPAWHGSNDNSTSGDWGESQVDLALAGVAPGDTVVLRWEFGQDGCNGNEGWYVDKVEAFTCGAVIEPPTEMCNVYPASGFLPVVGSPIVSLVGSQTTATVDGESDAISSVSVRNLKGAHTYMGDLAFTLQSPAGTSITLFDGSNCAAEEGIDVEFDDDASSVIGCSDWLSGGAFKPHEALATFNGEDANGEWTLTVTDSFPQDEGQIDGWELEFCTPIDDPEEPEGDGDKTTGGGWLATSDGGKLNIGFQARQRASGPQGNLQLNDKGAGVKIHLQDVTAIGPVDGMCGAISDGPNALEFRGTGTFNQAGGASFRVCVEDNGSNGSTPDRFYLACAGGCSYDTGARLSDDGLDGGNLQVHRTSAGASSSGSSAQQSSASTVILNPVLMTEGIPGSLQTLQVDVYDGNQEPLSGQPVSLTRVGADGSTQTLNAISSITGKAVFTTTLLQQDAEYSATAGTVGSNTVQVSPMSP